MTEIFMEIWIQSIIIGNYIMITAPHAPIILAVFAGMLLIAGGLFINIKRNQ
jgi:hypothetical protein